MSQIITVETSSDASLTHSVDTLEADQGPDERYNPHRYYWRFTLADTVDSDAFVADIESQLSNANWYEISYRWDGDEYSESTYRDDAAHYHKSHTLAEPPSIEQTADMEVTVSGSWIINGTVYQDTATISIPGVSDTYSRTDELVGTENGTIERNGTGVVLGTVIAKEPLNHLPTANIDPAEYPEEITQRGTVATQGTRPDSQPVAERVRDMELAVGKNGPGKTGIAQRIDDLEQRVSDLEGQ